MKKVKLTITLDSDIKRWLQKEAEENRISKSTYINSELSRLMMKSMIKGLSPKKSILQKK